MDTQFKIENIGKDTEFHQIRIKNSATNEYIIIVPEQSAQLDAAYINLNGNIEPVLSEMKSPNLKTNDELFNNAILFPFA